MLTRRRFCQYLTAATASAVFFDWRALPAWADEAEHLTVTELAPNRWVLSGGGGNVFLLANEGSPILIDACVGAVASELVSKVTERAGQDSCTLINTHHHGDHIGGNWLVRRSFAGEVRVIGHENLAPRVPETLAKSILPGMRQAAEGHPGQDRLLAEIDALGPADFTPDQTLATDLELEIGAATVQLHHFGPGHTDNDIVAFFPKQNVLHTGDLVFNDLHPYVFADHGATVFGWQKSLKQALKLCDDQTTVVPGHGKIDDRSALLRMSAYFDQVVDIVGAAIKEGRSRDEVAALQPEVFADRGFERVRHMALVRAFDEMAAGR